MDWIIPGTVLTASREDAPKIEERFSSMFLAGGISLSQVAGITGLEPYTIQNWVKRGLLPPPVQKRYNLNQLCRVMTIHMLKRSLPMERICGLLRYINGNLDDTSDDTIDDARLYFMFLGLAADEERLGTPAGQDAAVAEALAAYAEPVPGAAERVAKVLRIMLTAWAAARLHEAAEKMVRQLQTDTPADKAALY